MNNQNLIVYRFNLLYLILKELEEDINFRIIEISDEKSLINEINNLNNYLIITKKQILKFNNQFILSQLPIKIFKIIEKLNIEFLKQQFVEQQMTFERDAQVELAEDYESKETDPTKKATWQQFITDLEDWTFDPDDKNPVLPPIPESIRPGPPDAN